MAAAEQKLGLRERKKRRTHETIVAVATHLFAEQGYEATTTAQIAEAAEVSSSTFFKYFPTKADVVFSLLDALIESVDRRLTERRKDESGSEALVAWIETDLPEVEARYVELFQQSDRLIASDPDLEAQSRLRSARFEDVFAAAFARDLGEPADALRPRVLAAIAWRGMLDVWNAWRETHASAREEDINEICAVKADYVRRALDAGVQAIELLPRPA